MKTSNAADGLKLTGNRCLCSACSEIFNSVGAFDRHRAGKADARTCRAPRDIGMTLNAAGYWVTAPREVA